MEPTNRVKPIMLADQVRSVASEKNYALNIALVYQDAPTRQWAAQVCDQATRLTGQDSVNTSWWELSRLNDSNLLVDAIQTTKQADVILVSIYDAKELPLSFCAWIDGWLASRGLPMGMLIALISVPELSNAQANRTAGYLRAVASTGQLDFMLRERSRPAVSGGCFYTENTTGQTDSATIPFLNP